MTNKGKKEKSEETEVKKEDNDKMSSSSPPPPPSPAKESSGWFISLWTVIILPVIFVYMFDRMLTAAYNVWYPLPFVGYFRYDAAIALFFLVHVPLLNACFKGKRTAWIILAVLLAVTNNGVLPPEYHLYTHNPATLFEKPTAGVRAQPSGLMRSDADRLAMMAWKKRPDWVHDSTAYAFGRFHWGSHAGIERDARRRPELWSLKFGKEPNVRRLARESHYRLRFPKVRQVAQEKIRQDLLPVIRKVLARAVQASSNEQIVFGEELVEGLGLPTVVTTFPNALMQFFIKPQTAAKFQQAFETKVKAEQCTENPKLQAFFLPLELAPGAGLRYWKDSNTFADVEFQMGKLYTFDGTTLTAPLPLMYNELRRLDMSIILQTYGIKCDDERWVFFH